MPHGNLVWLEWMGAYIYANLSLHDIVAEELDILETPKISKEPKQAIDGGNVHRDKHGQSEKKIGLRVNLRPIRLRGLAIQSKDLLVQQKVRFILATIRSERKCKLETTIVRE